MPQKSKKFLNSNNFFPGEGGEQSDHHADKTKELD